MTPDVSAPEPSAPPPGPPQRGRPAPSVGVLRFLRDVRRHGFLDAIGGFWRELGDVFQVRVAGRTLMFAMHPDAVEQVNVTHRKSYDKRESYDGVRRYLIGEGLVASTGDLWLRQRRLMAPFFTTKGVLEDAEVMLRESLRHAERWQRLAATGEVVEVAEEMTHITAAIILRSMFGTGNLDEIVRMKDAVEAMIAFVNDRLTTPGLPLWMPTPANRRYKTSRAFVHETIDALIAHRRQTPEADWPDDLLTKLMRVRDDESGAGMSEALLRDEAITIFFAGHETTARTMTFAWYALARNPGVAARLHAELDEVLAGAVPTVDDLRRLPYTLAVVKEVLRMYPAAPFYIRDAVAPDVVGGFEVPLGASVMLSPFYTHRHPDHWPDPETFDPDRWTSEAERGRHKHAYHPFAAGPRICLGNNFSLLETHLMLAVLAQRFAPRLVRDGPATIEMQGVLGIVGGLPMVIEARAVPAVEA